MSTAISVTYIPMRGGGTALNISAPGVSMTLPLDRGMVLVTAASILHNAGIEKAAFDAGQLIVIAEQR
jgi:hypothetical protein